MIQYHVHDNLFFSVFLFPSRMNMLMDFWLEKNSLNLSAIS